MSEGRDERRERPDDTQIYEEFDLPREVEGEGAEVGGIDNVLRPAPTLTGLSTLPGVTRVDASPAAARPSRERRQAWERLWVAGLQSPWTSLALVPAVPGVSVNGVAEALVHIGSEYRGQAVELLRADGVRISEARALSERVGAVRERHALVVTLDCPLESQSALVVARAASAALLVIPLGPTPLAQARRTIETVGRARFIGAVTLQPREP